MKNLEPQWHKHSGPLTIWSKDSEDFITDRFRPLVSIVMPLIYVLLMFFGLFATVSPLPSFKILVGAENGAIWGMLVAITAALSIIGLVFRLRLEIYSTIVLGCLLTIYTVYVAVMTLTPLPVNPYFHSFGVIFAVATYPVMPGWRILDIISQIRMAKLRQLYAQHALGIGIDK